VVPIMTGTLKIQQRKLTLVNTDPQRRYYYGCHFSSELVWTEWSDLESFLPDDRIDDRLEFWRDLNAYAVRERGEEAKAEYRKVPK
jgi:hypothetical protein